MNTAFEVTVNDIELLLNNEHYMEGIRLGGYFSLTDYKVFDEIFGKLNETDMARIEKAALYGDDMDTQTDYAYQEIIEILKEKQVLIQLKAKTVMETTKYVHIQAVRQDDKNEIIDILVEAEYFAKHDYGDPSKHIKDSHLYFIETVQTLTLTGFSDKMPILFVTP